MGLQKVSAVRYPFIEVGEKKMCVVGGGGGGKMKFIHIQENLYPQKLLNIYDTLQDNESH